MVNQVLYEYDSNGLLSRDYSNPSGAVVVASTPYIGYTYDTTTSGGNFTKRLRPLTMKYPSGKTLTYTYGTAGSNDDLLGRLTEIKEGTTSLVQYAYNGIATPMKTTYPQPGLALDYTVSGALDNFNRITDHAWKKSTTDVVRIQHGYDRVGNRLYRKDMVSTTNSELYTYDGVNQVKSLNRGTLNSTNNGITGSTFTETWNHDLTGNWTQYVRAGVTENRTHNKANEIQTTCTHDKNGNMTVMPGLQGKYDAWNRLVELRNSSGTLLATYAYNGLNHRVKKTVGATVTTSFFNSQWQELETSEPQTGVCAYIWGNRYIDDLVLRDKGEERLYSLADPNWNVVAITNAAGTVQERMKYDAFGKITWLDAAFNTKASSGFAWNRSFTGQVWDNLNDLMLYRNRYYHVGLGRFISRDPIGYDAGDVSLYRYVENMSTLHTDPDGKGFLIPICLAIVVVGLAIYVIRKCPKPPDDVDPTEGGSLSGTDACKPVCLPGDNSFEELRGVGRDQQMAGCFKCSKTSDRCQQCCTKHFQPDDPDLRKRGAQIGALDTCYGFCSMLPAIR